MTAKAGEQQQRSGSSGQRGVSRVLAKLDISIENGNYYEAHQMYRTLYFRYVGQGKYNECLELLFNGAVKLIGKQQQSSAADLALLVVDTLEKRANFDDGELWIGKLGVIIAGLSAATVERETVINRAIKWSGEFSDNALGHPKMHKLIAQVFWTENNIEQARHHYLLCRDGIACGRILIKISNKGFASERDLFIVQAVLQQLCLKDTTTAEHTFHTYTANHPMIRKKEAPFQEPLLNFIFFLFGCIDYLGLDAFRAICDFYKASLDRDPAFQKYLTKIGVLYFGVVPPQNNSGGFMGNMFGDLFSRFLNGIDEEEEEHGGDASALGSVNQELD